MSSCRVSRFIYSYAECRHAECRYAECRYAECCYAVFRGAIYFVIAVSYPCKMFTQLTTGVNVIILLSLPQTQSAIVLEYLFRVTIYSLV